MLKIANSIKAPLVIVHIPQKGPWGEKEFYPSHRLSHWCHANGDYFIDTLPALKQSANHNICYWEKDGHCTAEGYKIIAETIYAELIAQKLIL